MNLEYLTQAGLVTSSGKTTTRPMALLQKNPLLLKELIEATSFLPADAPLTYRIYAVKNCLTEPRRCGFCNTTQLSDWRKEYCSRKCNDSIIDVSTGKTRKHLASEKMRNKRLALTEDGLTSFQRAALKVAQVLSEIDAATGLTKRQVINQKAAVKMKLEDTYTKSMKTRRLKMESTGTWEPLTNKTDYEKYVRMVSKVTSKQPIHLLKDYELRMEFGGHAYNIDHNFSVSNGFRCSIPPYIIGHICNLQILTKEDNVRKNFKCWISKEELFNRFFSSSETTDYHK